MQNLFEWSAGTTLGRDHLRALKNGHDAWNYVSTHDAFIGVVCDGCGAGEHSEVGAKLGARLLVQELLKRWRSEPEYFHGHAVVDVLHRVRRAVLGQLGVLADAMGGGFTYNIGNYFLFTILGVIVTPKTTIIFGAGDGVFWLNDVRSQVGGTDNRPLYLSYGLLNGDQTPILPHALVNTEDVKDLVLATDGVHALEAAAAKRIPGRDKLIGPVRQFVEQDRYFKNPYAIGHQLNLINRSAQNVDFEKREIVEEHGPLADDTTLLVLRRKA